MTNEPAEQQTATTTITGKARWLARAGILVALGLLLPATLRPCLTLHPTQAGLLCALVFAGAGLVGFLLATALWNRVLLGGRLRGELGRGNLAAGIVAAAHATATGIVAAHTFVADTLANFPVGAIFFAVSLLALVALSLVFRGLTSYADDQEILGENLAAATSYSGLVVALSIIVGHAADGAFVGWLPALREFAVFLLWAFLLYPVRQIVVGRLLLGFPLTSRGGAFDRAIAQEHDWVVSWVEAAGYLAAALLASGIS